MRLGRVVAVMALVSALGIGAAGAVELDDFKILKTRNLYNLCSAPAASDYFAEARQACFGFIYGAGLFYYELVRTEKIRKVVCADGEITRESARQAFVAWAADHPERMDESPIDGLMRAAVARWPCDEAR